MPLQVPQGAPGILETSCVCCHSPEKKKGTLEEESGENPRPPAAAAGRGYEGLPPQQVPIRQRVLSFLREIRYLPARDIGLLTRAVDLFLQEVFRHYHRQSLFLREGVEPADWRYRRRLPWKVESFGGAVTAIQR